MCAQPSDQLLSPPAHDGLRSQPLDEEEKERGRSALQFESPAAMRERRVSHDIMTALTQLELVSERTSEAIETLGRKSRRSSVCEEMTLPEWKAREQLVEIKSRLRETKAELASMSYRAEMLESETKNLRRQLAAACRQRKASGAPASWDIVAVDHVEASSPEESIPLRLRLEEKEAVVERLVQQLDFYARELQAKVEKEQEFKVAMSRAKERSALLESKLRQEEKRNKLLRAEKKTLLAQQDSVSQLSERFQQACRRIEELSSSTEDLSRVMTERDSVVNDLVIKCSVMEEKLCELRARARGMASNLSGDSEEELTLYRQEIAWLKRCLLRKLLPESEEDSPTVD